MSVETEPLVGRFDAQSDTANIEPLDAFVLPDFPEHLLPETLLRLSAAECDLALKKDILAVSWLPRLTFHAVLSEHGAKNAQSGKKRVIAKLNRVVFLKFVGKVLGQRLKFEATEKLRLQSPEFSASSRMTPEQMTFTSALMVGLAILLFALPQIEAFIVIAIVFNLFFLLTIAFKILWLFLPERATKKRAPIKLSDEELPIYTVLVPVFRETGVLHQLIGALRQLRYPSEKLDIKIIMEESDTAMHRALAGISLPPQFEVIIVPAGKPQTKPRALNYAMKFARGELLTIYDAEDIPEPRQLQKAAAKFSSAGPELSCLQAELAFYNSNENWLTRQFSTEYAMLFGQVLPGLAAFRLPIPLGGTSNHFRVSALEHVGGWDPYNVTEDADLGIRLARFGFTTGVLDSITYEEANRELGNWINQRARWLKGFLQTWLVHSRHPARLMQDLGVAGFLVALCSTFTIVIASLLYPIFLTLAARLVWVGTMDLQNIPHAAALGTAFTVSVLGYGFAGYGGYRALRRKGISGWFATLITMPVYWLLMSVAAWLGLWQFATRPFHWNKTRHGLSAFQQAKPK